MDNRQQTTPPKKPTVSFQSQQQSHQRTGEIPNLKRKIHLLFGERVLRSVFCYWRDVVLQNEMIDMKASKKTQQLQNVQTPMASHSEVARIGTPTEAVTPKDVSCEPQRPRIKLEGVELNKNDQEEWTIGSVTLLKCPNCKCDTDHPDNYKRHVKKCYWKCPKCNRRFKCASHKESHEAECGLKRRRQKKP